MLDHHWDDSETPFQWRFAGEPMMARFKWYFDHLSSHQLKKQNKKKTLSKLVPFYKSFWIRA